MKQIQVVYKGEEEFAEELRRIRQWGDSHLYSTTLFHIFTGSPDQSVAENISGKIREMMPDALYVGCSVFGSIHNGNFKNDPITVTCTFFEYATTKVQVLQYPLSAENQQEVADAVVAWVREEAWVQGIEMLATIRGMSMTALCDGLSEMRDDVEIFGGGALCDDINGYDSCVFSNEGGYMEHGVVFVCYGGEDLHLEVSYITGWKPLGSYLHVTAADGCILQELNHKPAYETYYKYLHIENDEDFFLNTLEFPFFYHYHGIDIMRAPVASNPDGSLVMTSDMNSGVEARIAYGDPWTILDATQDEASRLVPLVPECILIFSCAGRRTFWGDNEAGKETLAYQEVAPTSGFYTSGEFLRTGKYLNQHNVTQVIAAMREGNPRLAQKKTIGKPHKGFRGRVSIINRMATFIKATTQELEELNGQLSQMATTDGLTGLFNRREIQRRIAEAMANHETGRLYLIMLDLDHFKRINDVYGHQVGDEVLIGAASVLKQGNGVLEDMDSSGRWGGEEFMVLAHTDDDKAAREMAEKIRESISILKFNGPEKVTASIGVTPIQTGESPDTAVVRVDNLLYEAKEGGRDRVVFGLS